MAGATLLTFLGIATALAPLATAARIVIQGSGATFPENVYVAACDRYRVYRSAKADVTIVYTGVGSGAGRANFQRGLKNPADPSYMLFAGSDSVMSDKEYLDYPSSQMFPTLAGAMAVAYHPPSSNSNRMNLRRQTLVDIYTGRVTHWDDPAIAELNPNASLPHHAIHPMARMDKSGSTSVFTSALSTFSADWRVKPGEFETEFNTATWTHPKWNNSVVELYAKGTEGLTSLLTSIRDSIAYISVSDLKLDSSSLMSLALVRNANGSFVDCTVPASVQAAMDFFAGSMDSRLTGHLIDAQSVGAYPIATYTYLIINMNMTTRCEEATEFYGFLDWFYTDPEPAGIIRKNLFVPLSDTVRQKVREFVLNRAMCGGSYLRDLWLEKRRVEDLKSETSNTSWMTPTLTSVGIGLMVACSLGAYIARQSYQQWKLLNQDLWLVPIEEIVFFAPRSRGNRSRSMRSFSMHESDTISVGTQMTEDEAGSEEDYDADTVLQWPGKFREASVGVRLLQTHRTQDRFDIRTKKLLQWMMDRVHHNNVAAFHGLTQVERDFFVVSEYCERGPLSKVVHNPKLDLPPTVKGSIVMDICQAVSFLHSQGVVHGMLRTNACLIDSKWTVKLADWEYLIFYSTTTRAFKNSLPALQCVRDAVLGEYPSEQQVLDFDIYVAPEILRSELLWPPDQSSDIYSCAIIFYEIFTRSIPFANYREDLSTARDLLTAIVKNSLRPDQLQDIPIAFRQVLETSWSEDPRSRPSAENLTKLAKKCFPRRKNMLQSMFDSLESEHLLLENEMLAVNSAMEEQQDTYQAMIRSNLPEFYASRLLNDQPFQPEYKRLAGVLFVRLDGLAHLSDINRPFEVNAASNAYYHVFNSIAAGYKDMHMRHAFGDFFLFLCGLRRKSSRRSVRDLLRLAEHIIRLVRAGGVHVDSAGGGDGAALSLAACAGLHCGPVSIGVITSGVPALFTGGGALHVALQLALSAEKHRVLASETVRRALADDAEEDNNNEPVAAASADEAAQKSIEASVAAESARETGDGADGDLTVEAMPALVPQLPEKFAIDPKASAAAKVAAASGETPAVEAVAAKSTPEGKKRRKKRKDEQRKLRFDKRLCPLSDGKYVTTYCVSSVHDNADDSAPPQDAEDVLAVSDGDPDEDPDADTDAPLTFGIRRTAHSPPPGPALGSRRYRLQADSISNEAADEVAPVTASISPERVTVTVIDEVPQSRPAVQAQKSLPRSLQKTRLTGGGSEAAPFRIFMAGESLEMSVFGQRSNGGVSRKSILSRTNGANGSANGKKKVLSFCDDSAIAVVIEDGVTNRAFIGDSVAEEDSGGSVVCEL